MISIEKVEKIEKPHLELIEELLVELTGNDEKPDSKRIFNDLESFCDKFILLLLKHNEEIIGIMTIQEAFAFYAAGKYGIINELYIKPNFRSKGMGELLLNEAISIARVKNWKRIDVTAPPGDKWKRSQDFYLNKGFVFTGTKLKFLV